MKRLFWVALLMILLSPLFIQGGHNEQGDGYSLSSFASAQSTVAWTGFTADANPTADDIIVTVNDPSGTPANRKVVISNFLVDGLIPDDLTISTTSNVNVNGNDIQNVGDILFKTGATGGTLSTGTSNADKFILEGYDVDDGVYRNILEIDAGNTVTYEFNEDGHAIDFRVESDTDTHALFVDGSANNVGIGSSAPVAKLHVNGSAISKTLQVTGLDCTGNANGGAITADASGNLSCTDDDNDGVGGSSQWTDSGSVLYPTELGDNVGIGTSAATAQLEIEENGTTPFMISNGTGNGDFLIVTTAGNVGVGTNNPLAMLSVGVGDPGTAGANDVYLKNDLEVDGVIYADGGVASGGDLALGANNITMTGSLGSTGARVSKGWFTDLESTNMPTVGGTSLSSTFAPLASPSFTGNVGIGTTSPSSQLHAWGSTGITVGDATDANANLIRVIRGSAPTPTIAWDETNDEFDFNFPINVSGSSNTIISDGAIEIIEDGTTPFAISNGTSGLNDFLVVSTAGNVGIGTATASGKLHIEGVSGMIPVKHTSDPCVNDTNDGMQFWNDTAGEYCYCDNSGVDLRMKDSSTACF